MRVVANQAGAYPSFCSMKHLDGVPTPPPPPPGWEAGPWQGQPSALNSPVPIYTPGWREALLELSILPLEHNAVLDPESTEIQRTSR